MGFLESPDHHAQVIIIVTILCKWPAGTNIAVAVGVGVAICSMSYAWRSADTFEVIVSEDRVRLLGRAVGG